MSFPPSLWGICPPAESIHPLHAALFRIRKPQDLRHVCPESAVCVCVCVCVCARVRELCSVMSHSLWPHGLKLARLLCPWKFPGKDPGVGCHSLRHRIFPTQGPNPWLLHLLHWQADSLPRSRLGKPPELALPTLKRPFGILLPESLWWL